MKKHRKARKFLEELCKVPIVSVACDKLGLSRNTVYRWRNEDADFRKEMDKAMQLGDETGNDLAHSKLLLAVQRGEPWAIRYWLDNHHKNYIRPRSKSVLSELIGDKRKVEGFEVIIHHGKNAPTSSRDLKKNDDLSSA
jgi:hypothetical protein